MVTVQHSPSFGKWLERRRGSETLRAFQERTGVDGGTLSRTERDCTDVSLATAVRICYGLNLSLPELFQEWLSQTLPTGYRRPGDAQEQDVLTVREVQRWLQRLLEGHRRSRELLISALNLIVLHSGIMTSPLPQMSQLFTLADIEKMLWDLPWFKFEVAPPLHVEQLIANLDAIRLHGGLLVPVEIGAYVSNLRTRRTLRPTQLSDKCHITVGVLNSMENGLVQRLLLDNLLQLDDGLEQQGTLVALYWWEMESRLYLEAAWNAWPQAALYTPVALHKLVSLLISTGRWLQHIYQGDTTWLAMLRHELGLANPHAVEGEHCE